MRRSMRKSLIFILAAIVVLTFSAVYVLLNLAVDLAYTMLDPRIRY